MPNPTKPSLKTEIFPVIILVITLIASFYFYANFPDRVPTHWNIAGEVDGWSSRWLGAFLIPTIITGMYFLFLGLPYLDPKKDRYAEFAKVYHIFKTAIILLMALIYFITGLNALGYKVSVEFWIPLLIGILFIIMGSYMPKIKPNWFMGIRTPWTLSSEEVWNKTHRLGGKIFIIGGLLMTAMYFLPISWRLPLFIFIIVLILVGTMGYSYVLYRSEQKKK